MKTSFKTIGAIAFFVLLLIIPAKNNAGNYSTKISSNVALRGKGLSAAESKAIVLYDALKLRSMGLTKAAFDYAYKGYLYLQQKRLQLF